MNLVAVVDEESGSGSSKADSLSPFQFFKSTNLEWLEFSELGHELNGLNSVSGRVELGKLTAVISQSEKASTTLLRILSGRLKGNRVRGSIKLGSNTRQEAVTVGYIGPKTYPIYGSAAVDEELRYALALRSKIEGDRAEALLDQLLNALGLTSCRRKLVKKLSVKEKKRLAVAIELCAMPSLLVFDDFTLRGLTDLISIREVLDLMLQISHVIPTIIAFQQPLLTSTQILRGYISSLIVIDSGGNQVYSGPFKGFNDELETALCTAHPVTDKSVSSSTLTDYKAVGGLGGGFLTEFKLLAKREMKATFRDPRLFFGRIFSNALVGGIVAVIFTFAGDQTSIYYSLPIHYGSFVIVTFIVAFSLLVPQSMLLWEMKQVFVRERLSGTTSGPFALALTRFMFEVPVNFIMNCLLLVIVYWTVQWNGNFMQHVAILTLFASASMSYGYFTGFTLGGVGITVGVTLFLLLPQFLFIGALIPVSRIADALRWLTYVCSMSYALRLFSVVEFDYQSSPPLCLTPQICAQWRFVYTGNLVNRDDIWWYILVLVLAFVVGLRSLGFINAERQIRKSLYV